MLKKTYTKTGRSCRVTFQLPAEAQALTAALSGDFNDWDPKRHPMKRRKDGGFSVSLFLKPGQSYRFRYFLDGERWENDWGADEYLPNKFGTDDSVVKV